MRSIRRQSSDRLALPKDDQDTLIPCPCCHGTGNVILFDDGHTYRTKMCKWCGSSGAVNYHTVKAWNRLQRWINHYQSKKIPFRL